MVRILPVQPHRILLIKAHSIGIGDILRSSACWATIKRRWPSTELHLLFLNRWPGYPSEALIHEHFLLSGAHFLPMAESRVLGLRGVAPRTWRRLLPAVRTIVKTISPDLIVDCHPFGIETTIVTRFARRYCRAPTIGIAQVPGRGRFYDYAGGSLRAYARQRGLPWPMDYTNRDYAALAALGLERAGQRIVLQETVEGKAFGCECKRQLLRHIPIIGLNIGCGTPDALPKRPSIPCLVESLGRIFDCYPHQLVLTGASNERIINEKFISCYDSRWGATSHIWNVAGDCSLSGLTGVITLCQLFISSDSGPYHMSVALGVPTLAIFNGPNPSHYHTDSNVIIQVGADAKTTVSNALMLLKEVA